MFDAKRIDDGIDDCGRCSDSTRFAATLDPQRIIGRMGWSIVHVETGHVVGSRHGVIHIGSGNQLSVLIIATAFQQSLTHAMNNATVNLTLYNHRVYQSAKVIYSRILDYFNGTGLGVHFHFANVRTGRE